MNAINTNSLGDIFESKLENATVIGCGAVGSKISTELVRLGVDALTIYDFDEVEPHNLCNQAFTLAHVGMKKTEALKSLIADICSAEVTVEEKYVDQVIDTPIVFLCVDSMSARKAIMAKLLLNPTVCYVIETRMGVDEVRVYTVTAASYNKWKLVSDYDDSQAEVSACGTSLSVGPTSSICASLASWQFMKLHMDKKVEFEVIWGSSPMGMIVN